MSRWNAKHFVGMNGVGDLSRYVVGETTKRASLCSRAVENELLAREYIYLHHANRIFGVDSSATFDNKTIYHTSCILKQLLQWHCKIPN